MSDLLYKLDKSKEDIDELLIEHKGLVYFILSKLRQLDNPDAESAAWEALWDAINTFSVYSDTSFSTYACTVIRNAVFDVLRKQKTAANDEEELIERCKQVCFSVQDTDTELFTIVDKCFKDYIETKKGVSRDILLFWYGSLFSSSVSNIAVACNCAASYVCRVQDSFRAYLSGKLKQ